MDDMVEELLDLLEDVSFQTSEWQIEDLAKERFEICEKYGYRYYDDN